MLLWVCFAILTAAVVALLLQPLRAAPGQAVEPAAADLAVYRDQLRELETERERGLLVDSEIESARAEVARRLIKRAGDDPQPDPTSPTDDAASAGRARTVYTAIAALLPVIGMSVYLMTGDPQLPGQPFADRQAAPGTPAAIADLIDRVEEHLREKPEDGKGWDVVAPVYLRLGRYGDAAHAFAEASRLEGESVRRLMGFAEATLMAGDGVVSEDVRKASLRVLELEPGRIEPRIWLTLAKEQDGDLAAAVAAYQDMLATGPADAPWREAVTQRLALVTQRLKGGPAAGGAPGVSGAPKSGGRPVIGAEPAGPPPSAAGTPDVAAMQPAEREAFISSMVERLATRLKSDGRDLDGWIRLARAYKVLGREGDARAAIASARENFATDSASLGEIDKTEQSLGLGAKGEANPQ